MGCNKTLRKPKCIVRALSRKPQQQQSYSPASHSTASRCADSLRIGAQATHMKLVVSEDKACQASTYAAQMQIAALVQEQHTIVKNLPLSTDFPFRRDAVYIYRQQCSFISF